MVGLMDDMAHVMETAPRGRRVLRVQLNSRLFVRSRMPSFRRVHRGRQGSRADPKTRRTGAPQHGGLIAFSHEVSCSGIFREKGYGSGIIS